LPYSEIDDPMITKLTEYLFNSSGEINWPIAQSSTGMKKKLEFCEAILHNPTNLVLDEPFENLDVVDLRGRCAIDKGLFPAGK
jgi:ABC-type multidrug transport system ATPase subunit